MQLIFTFLLATFWLHAEGVDVPEVEIQFEPMVLGNGPPKELLEILGGGLPGLSEGPGPIPMQHSHHPKEAQLDKELFDSLLDGLNKAAKSPPHHHIHNPFAHHHPHFVGNPFSPGLPGAGPQMMIEIGAPSPLGPSHSAFPATMFRDLFPGPVGFDIPQGHPVPFSEPDPLVQSLVKDLDKTFVGLMSSIQKAAGADRTPNSCAADISHHCQGAKSKLHCLGQHASAISDACHKDIGKSVPFRCSTPIDKFCDVMEVGILQCLGDHMPDLNEDCKDAVLATHHVISKANTQKATVVDTSTGATQVSQPSPNVTPPPSIQGGLAAHITPLMLPPQVLEVLGIAKSLGDRLRNQSGDSAWESIKNWTRLVAMLTVLVFFLCRLPPTGWPERKLRAMLGMQTKEDQSLIASQFPVKSHKQNLELPQPVDSDFTA